MRMRTVWIGCGLALAVGAVLVEYSVRSEFSSARPGVAVPDAAPNAAERAGAEATPQEFALLELAVDTVPEPYVPIAFSVDVRGPSGVAATRTTEPSQNGVALFGPVPLGADVRVLVIAGGPRFGCDGDGEVIGEATTTIAPRGGRQFLVVPTHPPRTVEWGRDIQVRDDDGWPLPGSKLRFVDSGVEVEATERGFCPIRESAGTVKIEISPPAGRPDLDPAHLRHDTSQSGGSVVLRVGHRRDCAIDRLAIDCRTSPVDRVCLRAADGRAWARLWNVGAGGGLASVPLGRYVASWTAGSVRREGLLDVSADSVKFDLSMEAAPTTSLVVAGIRDPGRDGPGDGLVLVERSERSCLLPTTVLASGDFEMIAGCGVTSWFAFALPDENETPCFVNVAPGRYEIRTRRNPRILSHCVVVPETAGSPIRIVAEFRPREGTIHGTLRGSPQKKMWTVEARVFGEFSATKNIHVGDSYELTGLAPGVYSVWVSREDWGSQPLRGEPLPQSPWKNVVVDGVGSVTLDFEVN